MRRVLIVRKQANVAVTPQIGFFQQSDRKQRRKPYRFPSLHMRILFPSQFFVTGQSFLRVFFRFGKQRRSMLWELFH